MKWILGAIVLLMIGTALQLGLLVYAMYALLSVLVLSQYLASQWIENVDAARECNRASAQIDEKVAVLLKLRNTGWLTISWLIWEDSLPKEALRQRPPRIKVEKRRYGITRLRPGDEVVLPYQVTFLMRGYYQIGPVMLETGDLFGLHRKYRVLTEPSYILIYPKVLPITGYDVASRRPIGEVRMTHRLFEDPTRISGVRPYERGDPMGRIHWKATARTGQLHSKTYESSSIAGATILLDFHKDRYSSLGEPYRSELAITSAASIANVVYQMGQQIGFVTNGRDAADRIREEGFRHEFATRKTAQKSASMSEDSDRLQPVTVQTRRGADQLMRILETLARVELTDGLTFAQLVSEADSRLPRDATIVALLPDVPPETAIALGNLRRRGFAVTAVVVMYDDERHYPDCLSRLAAERIDVRPVSDEAMLSNLCAEQAMS